jgi:hypothetical protein
MAEKTSSVIAGAALGLSVATSIFSGYQWIDTRHQERINAAIEFSKAYLQDSDIAGRYAKILDYDPKNIVSKEDFVKERSFIDLLNYIANLANQNLIDNRYLSWRIKCDIYYVAKFVVPKRPDIANAMEDITRYVDENRAADCPERAQ